MTKEKIKDTLIKELDINGGIDSNFMLDDKPLLTGELIYYQPYESTYQRQVLHHNYTCITAFRNGRLSAIQYGFDENGNLRPNMHRFYIAGKDWNHLSRQ